MTTLSGAATRLDRRSRPTVSGQAPVPATRPPTEPPADAPTPRAARAGLALLVAGCAVFAVSTVARSRPGHDTFFDAWLYDGLIVLGAVVVAARGWSVPSERRAWWLVGAGLASSAAGEIGYSLVLPGDDATPLPIDLLYLGFYPLVYAGLVTLLRRQARDLTAAMWLDGVTAGLTLSSVAAAVAYGPISAATGGSTSAIVIGLAYPIGDLVLLAVVAGALAVLGWRAGRRWLLLAAGFALFAVADTTFLFRTASGTYVEGSWVDALWPTAGLLTALAAWHPVGRAPAVRRTPSLTTIVPPLVATGSAVAILVDRDAHLPELAVVGAAATVVSVAARLALTFRTLSVLSLNRQRQATTDDLTGTANRRALLDALASGTTGPTGGPALLLVDLIRFKEVNDALGHPTGDQLLRQYAARLAAVLGPTDLLARLAGDEFAVLLAPTATAEEAGQVADAVLAALAEPFRLDGITLTVEASVGIALCPDHCDEPTGLLQRADLAMSAAKASPEHVATYRLGQDAVDRSRLQMVEDLRGALDRGELVCHYQPQVTLADGDVHAVEALVRWQHPVRGLLGPEQFLPLVEQTGMMRALTARVLDAALAQAGRWRSAGTPLTVAVNLSVANLLDADLPGQVARLLRRHDVPASALVVEITESVLMTDSARARVVVDALHALGVGLSIDDYGTGFSSLAHLQALAVGELKLDRAFVTPLASDPRSAAIVRSTVDLAHSLGMRLVAEGVEDAATAEQLRAFGCDLAQGFHISRPLPADRLAAWLETRLATR